MGRDAEMDAEQLSELFKHVLLEDTDKASSIDHKEHKQHPQTFDGRPISVKELQQLRRFPPPPPARGEGVGGTHATPLLSEHQLEPLFNTLRKSRVTLGTIAAEIYALYPTPALIARVARTLAILLAVPILLPATTMRIAAIYFLLTLTRIPGRSPYLRHLVDVTAAGHIRRITLRSTTASKTPTSPLPQPHSALSDSESESSKSDKAKARATRAQRASLSCNRDASSTKTTTNSIPSRVKDVKQELALDTDIAVLDLEGDGALEQLLLMFFVLPKDESSSLQSVPGGNLAVPYSIARDNDAVNILPQDITPISWLVSAHDDDSFSKDLSALNANRNKIEQALRVKVQDQPPGTDIVPQLWFLNLVSAQPTRTGINDTDRAIIRRYPDIAIREAFIGARKLLVEFEDIWRDHEVAVDRSDLIIGEALQLTRSRAILNQTVWTPQPMLFHGFHLSDAERAEKVSDPMYVLQDLSHFLNIGSGEIIDAGVIETIRELLDLRPHLLFLCDYKFERPRFMGLISKNPKLARIVLEAFKRIIELGAYQVVNNVKRFTGTQGEQAERQQAWEKLSSLIECYTGAPTTDENITALQNCFADEVREFYFRYIAMIAKFTIDFIATFEENKKKNTVGRKEEDRIKLLQSVICRLMSATRSKSKYFRDLHQLRGTMLAAPLKELFDVVGDSHSELAALRGEMTSTRSPMGNNTTQPTQDKVS